MFHKMPIILIAAILAVLFVDPFLPLALKQFLLATSLTIKSLIVLALPFIIFALLFKASVMLASSATSIIGFVLILVCASNFLSTFLSHYVGALVYNFNLNIITPNEAEGLVPLWQLQLPKLIANDVAMFVGIGLGIISSKLAPSTAVSVATAIDKIVGRLLSCMVYIIPVFVIGFVVKLKYDGVVELLIRDYAGIFIAIALAQIAYISLLYLALNNFNARNAVRNIKNMVPAAISGFCTMSSAASMPLTIIAAEKNAQNKDISRSVIPATVNIHLVGDCFAIPIFAYAILKSFGMPAPSIESYMIFAFYFVIAKFSVAAIPGGGIIVMLPILEAHMGFNSEMMSLITALYILFDPVITAVNVLGNGAFAKLIDKSANILGKRRLKMQL